MNETYVYNSSQASKAYSKTWSFREDALLEVYKQMNESRSSNKDDAKTMLRAAVFLVNRSIKDKVVSVSGTRRCALS